ncbi:hypothetical protein EUTSA_v10000329mg [Eutrema salsugineum]|uniref:PLAT domain-containing protein n=1 Tax=Eutrema salsugineum TaxID=72664 RepID=V4M1P3_EUTSA|nr:PLAT domain-containing protein 2 [Eutrema salsugineum]ESQ46123.1 hypothetical protein EUTSA_v10000329mg [Eutrema salsugineum]
MSNTVTLISRKLLSLIIGARTMARCDVLVLSLLIFIATVSVVAFADREPGCVYTFYVQTGFVESAGTDSIISATISDKSGQEIVINNLESWGGLMGSGYDYFENGNVDIFSGKEKCLPSPVCALNLTSDGSHGTGTYAAWFVNYVEVTTVGLHANSARQYFDFEKWLGLPASLTAVRNKCPVSLKESVSQVGSEIPKTLS